MVDTEIFPCVNFSIPQFNIVILFNNFQRGVRKNFIFFPYGKFSIRKTIPVFSVPNYFSKKFDLSIFAHNSFMMNYFLKKPIKNLRMKKTIPNFILEMKTKNKTPADVARVSKICRSGSAERNRCRKMMSRAVSLAVPRR